MLRINYTNPLTRQYQYEYAMYKIVSEMFAGVECRSLVIDQLRLYYADLVKESRSDSNKEKYSYAKQREVDAEVQSMVERYVKSRIEFPQMNICRAEVRIRKDKNGCHSFSFTDGIYSLNAFLISASVLVSTAEVESSRIRIFGFLRSARAIQYLCFCPPETFVPPCSIFLSRSRLSSWASLREVIIS